ncbi:hypothetical protein [Stagnihabitans tardus]|uniref:TonB C-terminal domain-containing protein n=1 Tax=Stagnihabitans tardus TaxID=2699202 RepID=A0AAE4Y7X9_9RHOB|nr:hypothetical protein [Stagnihabitans tardus]NBZ87541.1 hypothetical protein [Stagnihabitans tardus]
MMRGARVLLVLALGLSAPVCHADTKGALAVRFPVISGWVLWRVAVAGTKGAGAGDVTVELADRARVDQRMAEAAGRQACAVLGRRFAPAEVEAGARAWTWRGACL